MAEKSRFMSEEEAWTCVILHKDGQTFEVIGEKLGRHPTSVSRAFKRYRETGTPLRGKKNCGNTATTPQEDAAIINYSQNHPFDPVSKIKQRLNLEASLTTIKCRLRANGLFAHRPARKPRLTQQHKDDRLAWCTENEYFDWGSVVFSDETVVCTSRHGLEFVRRPKNTRFEEEYVREVTKSGRISISCWGMIWRDGLCDLVWVPSTMNGQKYRDWILEKYMTPFMHAQPDLVFQQDNSSVHCSKLVSNYLDSVNILPLQWPSKSPDLKIIENLWHILKELVGPVNHINADHILWYSV